MSKDFHDFLNKMPKAELHLHIDGCLSPEMMFKLAQKNGVSLLYKSLEEVEAAYQFTNLQSFLDLYYQGAAVLKDEQDFYDLTWDYLLWCRKENIVHTEISFDPQTHTERGIPIEVEINGIANAMKDAKKEWGQSSLLIMSFLRHLSEESALATLEQALPFLDQIVGVGLDSTELGRPPEMFKRVMDRARAEGLKIIAHAGEEGPPDYIWQAINLLQVDRIDHGVRVEEDPELMTYLAQKQIPLTVCPLSNVCLCVFDKMENHNILKLHEAGLKVTVNSDDPAYFGGYMNANFLAMADRLPFTQEQAVTIARNGFEASFLDDSSKSKFIDRLDQFASDYQLETGQEK